MISHITFASVPVTDADRAIRFWTDSFGFTVSYDGSPVAGMRWVMLKLGEARTQLHLEVVRHIPESQRPVLPLEDDDVHGTVAMLRSRGVAIVSDPGPAPWNPVQTYAVFRDSEGNMILLASAATTSD